MSSDASTGTTPRVGSGAAEDAPRRGAPPAGPGRPAGPRRDEPGGRLPDIPGPLETLGLAWRRLRRMSTALMLLFAVASASIIATFVPQEPIVPTTVADWRSGADGPGAAVSQAFDALGFYDVFGSSWFNVLLVLLFTSLTGCLIPRYRAFVKVARRAPDAGRNLERLSTRAVLRTSMAPDDAAAAMDALLRRKRFRRRTMRPDGALRIAAERGHLREGGSLVFHTAFYVLLIGIAWGQLWGFTGQINIEEGKPFAETALAYDLRQPGRLWGVEDHRGFVVTLDDFDVSYFANATPADFVSTVTFSGPGRDPVTEQVRVNHPVSYEGMTLYQARFGMAPEVVLRNRQTGEELFRSQVMLNDAGGNVWTGVAKVSMGGAGGAGGPGGGPGGTGETAGSVPQIALDLVLVPDGEVVADGAGAEVRPGGPELAAPKLLADLYIGEDLGLARNVPASQFDRSDGPLGPTALLEEGQSVLLAGGLLEMTYETTTMWSGLQVSHQPGRWVLLLAGTLVLGGLIPSLYSYRRRLWAEVRPLGPGTPDAAGVLGTPDAAGVLGTPDAAGTAGSQVLLAGVALQRKERFEEEFAQIVEAARSSLGATPAAPPPAPDRSPLPHPGPPPVVARVPRPPRDEDTA